MWFFSKPKSYLGIDLGAGGVKVVELKKEKNRPVLFTYGMTVGAQDVHRLLEKKEKSTADLLEKKQNPAEAAATPGAEIDQSRVANYAALIKAVCKQAKTVSKIAVASLPVSAVFHAIVNLPVVKKEDFDRIVRAEVKKLLPYPLEDLALDTQVLPAPPDSKVQKVLVNAVPRPLVAFYSQIFKEAGLILDALEPESTALARCLIGRDTAVTLIIDIGAERTNFFIVDQSVPVTHHSIEIGGTKINKILENALGIDSALTEQLKKDLFTHLTSAGNGSPLKSQQFLELFNPIVDPIAKEITYSLELYLRQSENQNKHPEKIILTGGGALFPFLADFIAAQFKLKCYVGDPWGRVVYQDSLKPLLRSIAPRMSVAIGLALRNVV